MKKIFTIYNLMPEFDSNSIEVSTTKELYDVIRKYWNVGPSRVQFGYNKHDKWYDVRLISKTGMTFAVIGEINFNPYE